MEAGPLPLDLRDLRALTVLGRGAKGVVLLVRDGASGRPLALKAISRPAAEKKARGAGGAEDAYRRIWFERDVLGTLRHPLLPELRGFVSTEKIVGFAMERCPGGDLGVLRRRQTEKMFSDEVIRFYAAELVLALEHLHSQGIVYRDLKPENVLIQGSGHVMLVDFDLSARLPIRSPAASPTPSRESDVRRRSPPSTKRNPLRACFSWEPVTPRQANSASSSSSSSSDSGSGSSGSGESAGKSNSFVGTEEYVAPEVILGSGHDFAVDWWSLGVVLYEMLYGRTPFRGQNRKETFSFILAKPPELMGEKTPLRDLIGRLLEKDPRERITCEGIRAHDFFRGLDWESVLDISRPPYIPPVEGEEEPQTGEEEEPIDVEKFVEQVFGTGAAKEDGSKGAAAYCDKDGRWVETLSNQLLPKAGELSVF